MKLKFIAFAAVLALIPIVVCAQEPSEDNRTIATYLEEYPGNIFSDFVYILKKTDVWSTVNDKDGHRYTCFAPTNDAVRNWLSERNINSIENIPSSSLDSIARTHICKGGYALSDFIEGRDMIMEIIPSSNLMNRLMVYSYVNYTTYFYPDPETVDSIVRYSNTINEKSNIISQDYLLANGFVNVVDRIIEPSIYFLPEYLDNNNKNASSAHKATLFAQALKMTGLSDTLEQYIDFSYPSPQFDSTLVCLEYMGRVAVEYETAYETFRNGHQQRAIWPDKRLFKYTLFVVTDSVLESVYGIRTINDLKAKARSVYPEGASLPDTDRNSSLYKLISYHILPCWLNRNMMNYTDRYVVDNYKKACPDAIDMEDYYETMHPYAIMRISTPYDRGSGNNGKNIFINRKGTITAGNLESKGIRIWRYEDTPGISTASALNGGYYFVDSLLLFDRHTKNALNTRMRVMFSTLSPDFINSGARGRMRQSMGDNPASFAVYAFKEGYCKNVSCTPETFFAVRYMDKDWGTYYSDELTLRGNFDITFRLPPVPSSGLYEIRISGNTPNYYAESRGTILYYIRKEGGDFIPCGTPVDMTISPTDPRIGYIRDSDLDMYNETETEAAITANDRQMRSNGYMKYPDSYAPNGNSISNRLRNQEYLFRKIVCEMYLEAGKDYYLRLRQVNGNLSTNIPLNFLELVPHSVYSGENGPEDRH